MTLCSSAVGTSIHVRVHLILSPRQLARSRFRGHSQHNRCRSRRRCSSRYCFCLCSNLGSRWTSRSCFGWRSGDKPWCCRSVPVVEAGLCVANHLAQGIHLGSRSSPASEVPTTPSPCGPWPPPPPDDATGEAGIRLRTCLDGGTEGARTADGFKNEFSKKLSLDYWIDQSKATLVKVLQHL